MTNRKDIKLALLMSRLIDQIIVLDRNEKACQGVTLSQHYALDALYRKKSLTMKELSEELNLAISTLTRIMDVLVRKGIVIRKSHEKDRRKVIVELSGEGLEIAKKLNEYTQLFWTSILKAVPDEKKPELSENVKLLLDAMQNMECVCQKTHRVKTVSTEA